MALWIVDQDKKEAENQLDEKLSMKMIKQTLSISGATYSEEELGAAKRDITWKYQIFTTPGQNILADYDEADWYEDAKRILLLCSGRAIKTT